MAAGATVVAAAADSPRRGRRSVVGSSEAQAEVTTPPKTPAKSPRTAAAQRAAQPSTAAASASAAVGGCSRGTPGALLPHHICEAVTRVVWAQAKAQAARPAGAAAAGVPEGAPASGRAPQPASPPLKRRLELPGDLQHSSAAASFAFPGFDASQPSQSQSQSQTQLEGEDGVALAEGARLALAAAMEQLGSGGEVVRAAEVLSRVRSMALAATAYWREVSIDLSKAAASLARFLAHQRRLFWGRPPWRGVNLGGWLILEPGPSAELFDAHGPAACEWDLMARMRARLGDEAAEAALRAHRDSFVTEEDFRRIRSLGFNAVRIPFGYWVVTGPGKGEEVYAGPALEFLDRALAWCKACGLQALLDLHGAPGGESGERPCGRERADWHWGDWRLNESIEALRVLAERYRGHPCVAGVSVCNEPSETLPAEVLCNFYDCAVRTIREAGMPPDEVAVVLPAYRTERLDEIWRLWNRRFDGFARHTNVAFDLHLYHCFGPWWQRQGLGSHLRMAKRHRKILRRVPAVVGEWSLALPPGARAGDDAHEEDLALAAFAAGQLEAYGQASHGWFFWNWRDSPRQHAGWDARKCFERQWLTKGNLEDAVRHPAAAPTMESTAAGGA
uniref:glucan 1,3-beta-glucosidase n=1 Tax=Pyrodinium bahamense TaxID=73915 RepID=A0A7S0B2T8_9DINO